MYFCHNCGTQLREDARFCHNCGAEQPVEAADETPAPYESQRLPPTPQGAKPVTPPGPVKAEKPLQPAPAAPAPEPPKPEAPPVQLPFPTGSYTWENVKISGEFKNGIGSITITFH